MPDNNNQNTEAPVFKVKVEGTEIPADYNLVSVMVQKLVNKLPLARLILLDGNADSTGFKTSDKDDFLPGKKIQVEAGYGSNLQTIFKGIVVKHSVKVSHSQTSMLVIECKDEAIKLSKARKSKYYTDQKDSEIMEALADAAGVQKEIAATDVSHKEMVQYYCSDWDFMITRAEANGMLVMPDEGKIYIKKPELSGEAVLKLTFGQNILEFDAELDAAHQFETIKGIGWDYSSQEMTESEASIPSVTQAGNVAAADLVSKTGENILLLKHSGKLPSDELKAWAESYQLKNTLSKIRGRAKCNGNATLKPGVVVELDAVGQRFNGKVYISGARHELNQGNWLTDIQFGLSPELFIREYNVNEQPASALLPGIHGLQTGVVTQIESDPDGEDRILVKMPVVDPDADGVWARVASLDAGKERGSFFRPEIEDEVILGFINGDPRQAVVLGMLNSSAKPAPVQAKDTNHEKGFQTREKLKLWFNDEKKSIEIETPGGNKVVISDDAKGISFEDQNGNKITMNDSGIEINSAKDLILKASGNLNAGGNQVEVKADSSAKISGSSGAEFTSSGTAKIQGSVVQIN